MLAWADGKTLQSLNIFHNKIKWIDYAEEQSPVFIDIVKWRIKPEPRRMWTSSATNARTENEAEAEDWKKHGHNLTEWMEVVK